MSEGQAFTSEDWLADPLDLARSLLGAVLVHEVSPGRVVSGRIVETEAYRGEEDQACHARAGRTPRTEVMYRQGGVAYVYLIYGMYHLLNVVCWPEGQPAAVLLRAVEPLQGLTADPRGPGKLTRAMGIGREHNGVTIGASSLSILKGQPIAPERVASGPRIGVDYAGEWAQKPWRFWVRDSPWVSRKPPKNFSP
jgi:DNA-3-methyladenine glycosylase